MQHHINVDGQLDARYGDITQSSRDQAVRTEIQYTAEVSPHAHNNGVEILCIDPKVKLKNPCTSCCI